MEPRLLAYQSGTLTTTPECLLYLCEAIIEPYSCMGDSVQFIEFNENLFILEKRDWSHNSCLQEHFVCSRELYVLSVKSCGIRLPTHVLTDCWACFSLIHRLYNGGHVAFDPRNPDDPTSIVTRHYLPFCLF